LRRTRKPHGSAWWTTSPSPTTIPQPFNQPLNRGGSQGPSHQTGILSSGHLMVLAP
jgi:hypothetical protein